MPQPFGLKKEVKDMMIDIGNPQNCYECLIRNRGYSGDGMKCGKTGSVISWYDGNRQRMADCPLEKEVKDND